MYYAMRIIKYFILILILSSCSKSSKDLDAHRLITFEKGFINDSIPEELFCFSYYRFQNGSLVYHNYKLDSMFYVKNSTLIKQTSSGYFYGGTLYFQSINKDTLFVYNHINDPDLLEKSHYILTDTLHTNYSNYNSTVYKYEILNPPCDGDLTLVFSEEFGLIERFNEGWKGRFTIHKDFRLGNNLKGILLKIRSYNDFYYNLTPPPPPPKLIKLNSVVTDEICKDST